MTFQKCAIICLRIFCAPTQCFLHCMKIRMWLYTQILRKNIKNWNCLCSIIVNSSETSLKYSVTIFCSVFQLILGTNNVDKRFLHKEKCLYQNVMWLNMFLCVHKILNIIKKSIVFLNSERILSDQTVNWFCLENFCKKN